ncbi:MAG: glycosyltransferase family 2 protein [Acetobacteraceae bacterium]|nr:glycosyltransferase family 2 protein [Acetobacteraceae bacterium]
MTNIIAPQIPELCLVIPVLNERANIAPLVGLIDGVLGGIAWEVIFVDDDSRDGTRTAIADIAAKHPNVRLLHRIGRRGLASAFVEGAQASLAPLIGAMDGDLQHDERLLPQMVKALRSGDYDIAMGSRHVAGGGLGDWDKTRAGMSDIATRLSRAVLKTPVSDPMSGFFMLPRPVFEQAVRGLSAIGFKILLDIIASLPTAPRIKELPYVFRTRVAGESKLDAGVLRDFALLLLDKMIGHIVPVTFVMFAFVGALGIAAHLLVLRIALTLGHMPFSDAQLVATGVAILGNFALNNIFTFGDRRLRGWGLLRGFLTFAAICAVGAIGNLGVAGFLFGPAGSSWWVAGVVGAGMSLVWNYAVSSEFTWRRK